MDSNWHSETLQETLDRLSNPHAIKAPELGASVIVVSKAIYDRLTSHVSGTGITGDEIERITNETEHHA
jgi:hypothetical protein